MPLAQIYQLINEQWFIAGVNTSEIVDFISKKIMINGSIKKKLFHLELARFIFSRCFISHEMLEIEVRSQIVGLNKMGMEHDELFDFPSVIHYLLYFMVRFLDQHLCLQVELPDKENHFTGRNIMDYLAINSNLQSYAWLINSIFSSPFLKTHHIARLPNLLTSLLKIR